MSLTERSADRLAEQRCEACRSDTPKLSASQVQELLAQLPGWELRCANGVDRLVRSYELRDFSEALSFTNRIGAVAEAEGHHPDLLTRWGSVEVTWWTHKIEGLHLNDFIMAARSDLEFDKGGWRSRASSPKGAPS